jgi:outer membrane protein assembly factor BamB
MATDLGNKTLHDPKTLQPRIWNYTRLLVAAVVTLTVLPYAWGRCLILSMQIGQPETRFLVVLFAGILAVLFLSRGLAPAFAGRRVLRWADGIVAICWIAVNGALVWLYAAPDLPRSVLVGLFVLATLWVWWLAWMFYRPRSLLVQAGILILLLGCAAAFPLTVRVKGMMGSNIINFAWRVDQTEEELARRLARESAVATGATADLAHPTERDYPQFLGPARSGIVSNARLARDWSQTPLKQLWRRPIGGGWSSFAVVGDYAITEEQRESQECVVCYRLTDGALVWIHSDPVYFGSSLGGPGPRATPTIAGGRVYAVGATGILNCLDGVTGKPVWSVNILDDNNAENISHGICGSPLVMDKEVIVSPTGTNGICLAAYDRYTGSRLWQGGQEQASYSSPMLAKLDGIPQILLHSSQGVAGYDPKTGRRLWGFPWTNSESVICSQPIPHAGGTDRVLACIGYGKGSTAVQIHHSQKGDDAWECQPIWESRSMKAKFMSPVFYQGSVFGLDDGILACLDPTNGKQRWKGGRYGHGQVVLAGDLLIVQAEDGTVALVEPDPKSHRELSRVEALSGKTWNNPAIAGKYLLVRNDHEAACFELPLRD